MTADLDERMIITQDVGPVSHLDTSEPMVIVGRDIERYVRSAAVKPHVAQKLSSSSTGPSCLPKSTGWQGSLLQRG